MTTKKMFVSAFAVGAAAQLATAYELAAVVRRDNRSAKAVVPARRWTDVTSHVDVVCMEIDGRDTWLATDDVGLIAMSYTREGLDAALGTAVIPGGQRWATSSQPNDA